MYWKFSLLFLCIFFLSIIEVFSINVGEITGKVIDGETGEVLRRASIFVMSSKNGGYSDVKGDFKIKNVESGTYKLKISYVGYVTKYIDKVQVISGKTTKIGNVVLYSEKKTTEDVVVEEKRINDNQSAILSERKNSSQVSDGISIEEIKKLPDNDAGQSLKRVTGLTLMNDKFIYVRGLNERYSNTMLNGASLSSTEPDKKAFAFNMFPSEFIENAKVIKSYSPDLPGNFAGGLVILNTVEFPSKKSLKINITSSISDNLSFKENGFINYMGSSNDVYGFNDGSRAMPDNIPNTPMEMLKLIYTDMKSNSITPDEKYELQQKWISFGGKFNNDMWNRDTSTYFLPLNVDISFSNIYNIADNDFGIIASAFYNNNNSFSSSENGVLLANGDYKEHAFENSFHNNVNLGGLFNIAYKIGNRNSISFKNTYNEELDKELLMTNGEIVSNNVDIRYINYDFVRKELFASQLTGEHDLSFINSIFDWKIGYSSSLRDQPDYRKVRYQRTKTDSTLPFTVDLPDNPQGNGIYNGRFYSNLNESAWSGSMNLTIPFENFKIKTGAFFENKRRDFVVRSFTVIRATTLLKSYYVKDYGDIENWVDDSISTMLNSYADPSEIFNKNNFYMHGLAISEDTHNNDSYKADDNTLSAYLLTDFPMVIFNNNFRIIGGFRVEQNTQKLNNYFTGSSFVNNENLDFIPSLNIIYQLSKEINIRGSLSNTITRPELRELAPFAFYDFQKLLVVQGDTNLVEAKIQNYDLRFEYFPNPSEVMTVGIFYKIFDHAIEETIIPQSSERVITWNNAAGLAYNYGIELEVKKGLSFISDLFNNFAVSTNLTLINSNITVSQNGHEDTRAMWGQSPYSFNFSLYYYHPDWGTNMSLGYNVSGKKIIQVANINSGFQFENPHIYELPKNSLDFSITQNILINFDIKFSAQNILNEATVSEQGGYIVNSTLIGRKFTLNFGYSF
jgi:hypothetical protein